MSFTDKKGVRISAPFKLHANYPLDVRETFATVAERDALVGLNAVYPGLKVWVEATNTEYIWTGKEWQEWVKTVQDKNVSFNMFGSTQIPMKVYGGDTNGQGVSLGAGGATIVGGGESAKNLEAEVDATNEKLVLASDTSIDIYTNAQNIADKKGLTLDNNLNFFPMKDNTGKLGTSTNRYSDVYAVNLHTTNLDGTNITFVNATLDNVTPSKDNYGYLGSSSKRYADIYGVNFHGTNGNITNMTSTETTSTNVHSTNMDTTNLISENADLDNIHPTEDNTGNVGTKDKRYKDGYIENLYGTKGDITTLNSTTGNITNVNATNTTSVNNTLTNVDPPTNGTGHLGSTDKRYLDVYSDNFTGTTENITSVLPNVKDTGNIGATDKRFQDAYINNIHGTNADITNMTVTDADMDVVHPGKDNTGSIGKTNDRYADIYGVNFHGTKGDITTMNSTTTNSTNVNATNTTSVNNTLTNVAPPADSTGHIGTTDKRYLDIFSDNFTGTTENITSVLPNTKDTGNIGATDKRFKDAYVNNYYGTNGNITNMTSTNTTTTNLVSENADLDNIHPTTDNTGNVGSADHRYKDGYIENLHGSTGSITTMTSATTNSTNVNATNVKTTDTQSVTVHPAKDNSGSIGAVGNRYADIYGVNIHATNADIENIAIENADINTLHPEEDATGSVGTADYRYQDIYGVNFHGTKGDITTLNSTTGNITNVNATTVKTTNTTSVNNTLTNVTPPKNGDGTIGTTDNRYGNVFSNNFTGTNGNITNVTSTNVTASNADLDVVHPGKDNSGSIGKSDDRYADIYGVNVHATTTSSTNVNATNTTSVNNTLTNVDPPTNGTGHLGSTDKRYADVYSNNFTGTNANLTNVTTTNVKANDADLNVIHPDTNNTGSVGTADKYYKDIYGTNFHGSTGSITTLTSTTGNITNVNATNVKTTDTQSSTVHPATTNTGSVGTADKYYADIYGTNFHGSTGNITTMTSTTTNSTNVNATNVKTTDTQSSTVHPATTNTGSIGTADKYYKDIYGTTLHSTTGEITNVNSTNMKSTNGTFDNVTPSKTNTGHIGTADNMYADIYGTNIHGTNGSITTLTSTTGNITNVNATNIKTTNTQSTSVYPGTTNTGSVGTTDKYYKDAYVTNYHGTSGNITTMTSTTTNSTNVNATTVKSTNATLDNVLPSKAGTGNIGSADSKYAGVYATSGVFDNITATSIKADITGNLTGNASTASKLNPGRTINTTKFDGSTDIVTDTWGKARNITISDGTNSGTAASVNGGANVTLLLPTTIKATFVGNVTGNVTGNLTGNAATATKFAAKHKINGTDFDGSGDITTTKWGTSRKITISDGANSGTATAVDGSADVTIPLPANIKATTFTGNLSGNASSATQLANNRTFTIQDAAGAHSGAGVSFNGTGNVTMKMPDRITSAYETSTYLAGNQGNALINSSAGAGKYVMLAKMNSNNGYFTIGSYTTTFLLQYTAKTTADGAKNQVDKSVTLLDEAGNSKFPGTVTAPTFSGNLSGNASTASKWQTARTFYIANSDGSGAGAGVTVDGAGNVTLKLPTTITATVSGNVSSANKVNNNLVIKFNGGTVENTSLFTYNGSAAKTVNITPAAIGASATSHTHSYAASPSAGGQATYVYVPRVTGSGNSANYTPGTSRLEVKEFGTDCTNIPVAGQWWHIYTGQGTDANYNTQLALAMTGSARMYYRLRQSGAWGGWNKVYTSADKPTAADVGASASGHTHSYAGSASTGGAANSVANSLKIQLNSGTTEGVSQFTFNGSAAKNINITPANIGAATSGHTHSYAASSHTHAVLKLQINGTDKLSYNGGTAVTLNLTPAVLGAAAASHGYHVVGRTINGTFATNFRAQVKGDTASGDFIAPIRNDTASVANSPQYGTGIGFGRGDTHGYIYMSYSSAALYVGAGNSGKLVWQKQVSFTDHTHSYAGSSSAGGAATSANKVNQNLIIKLNGGTAEGSTQFTFNGSAAKTVNITPGNIGAATSGHTHSYAASSHIHAAPVGTIFFSSSTDVNFFKATYGGTWVIDGNMQLLVGSTTQTIYMHRKTAA